MACAEAHALSAAVYLGEGAVEYLAWILLVKGALCGNPTIRKKALVVASAMFYLIFIRGSSTSRRPSPRRLTPITVVKMDRPGKIVSHPALLM